MVTLRTHHEGDLHAFVTQRLAPLKVPRYIEMVDALPLLTWSEKIAQAELKASRSDRILGSGDALHGASESRLPHCILNQIPPET